MKTGIEIVMGKTGSGKTTYLACMARKYIDKGIDVYSNVNIKGAYKISIRDDLMNYQINDALIIIDEAGLEFNARDFKSFTKNLYEFFTMHRHYRLRIIISVQYWDRVDIVIRELVHSIYLIERSLLNFRYIALRRIAVKVGINEQQKIDEMFFKVPFLLGGVRYYNKYKGYPLFNTHEARELPLKKFDKWGNIQPKLSLIDKITVVYYALKNYRVYRKLLNNSKFKSSEKQSLQKRLKIHE